jgi:predicted nucleotidyltransferase
MTPEDRETLARLRASIEAAYGPRLRRVVLFGSRARGDHLPDSDYDLAVFLDRVDDWWEETQRLVNISFDSLGETQGALISAQAYADADFEERTPLMNEIRREGVAIGP